MPTTEQDIRKARLQWQPARSGNGHNLRLTPSQECGPAGLWTGMNRQGQFSYLVWSQEFQAGPGRPLTLALQAAFAGFNAQDAAHAEPGAGRRVAQQTLAELYADRNAIHRFGELCRQCRSRFHQAEIYESCYQCPRWNRRSRNDRRSHEQQQDRNQDYRQNHRQEATPPPRLPRGISDLDLLGLPADAGPAEVRKAYRQIMMAVHPDKAGPATEHLARLVNQAYQNLNRD